jgi:thioredoxin-like negative regulator of GroEL
VLLDFDADWCGPCRQMHPTIDRLAENGYPVRRVNVDNDPVLAEKFDVQGIPCFVMLVEGREVDRVVGRTNYNRLKQMFTDNGVRTQ